MFEHVVLRRSENGQSISIGRIAEALLYYQKIHLFLDIGTLLELIKKLGTAGVLRLLRRPEISAVYCEESTGVASDSVGVSRYHNFIEFSVSGHKDSPPMKKPIDRLLYRLEVLGIEKREAKRFAEVFLDRIPLRRLSGDYFTQGGMVAATKKDLADHEYAKLAMAVAVRQVPGGYQIGENFRFEIIESELGIFVFTDIDFARINAARAELTPPQDPIDIAHFLSLVFDAHTDLTLAAFYGGDFVTSSVTSSIIQVRHAELLRRSNLNTDSRENFTDLVLPDMPRLSEVIDAGDRSFEEFLKLLDRADRFKDWLKAVNPDEDLVRTYVREISSESWVQGLRGKSLRYVLASAIGASNPIAGLAAGFADTFLIDKLFSGWRPNHFVDGKLSSFVQTR